MPLNVKAKTYPQLSKHYWFPLLQNLRLLSKVQILFFTPYSAWLRLSNHQHSLFRRVFLRQWSECHPESVALSIISRHEVLEFHNCPLWISWGAIGIELQKLYRIATLYLGIHFCCPTKKVHYAIQTAAIMRFSRLLKVWYLHICRPALCFLIE